MVERLRPDPQVR